MARKTEIIVVDGERYSVTQLSATVGADLYEDLLRMIGPSMREVTLEKGTDPEALVLRVLLGSIGALPPGMVNRLGKLFAAHTKVLMQSGKAETAVELNEGMYEDHFSGRMGHLTRWILSCLRFNFADFLPSAVESDGKNPASAAKK